jgi:hypothetical protein
MPIPTEPVSGANIASVWGSSIHNAQFTPAGFIGAGDPVTMLAAEAYRDMPFDATTDPGGWYDGAGAGQAVVAAEGAGLYLIVAHLISDGGAALTGKTSIVLWRNGTEIGRAQEDNEGTLDVGLTLVALEVLEEGDAIRMRGRNLGTGTLPSVYVRHIAIVRVGWEIGIAM